MKIFTNIVALTICFSTIALARLSWDPDVDAAGVQGGSGNWVGGADWWNGTTNTAWDTPDSVIFEETPGRVAVNRDVTATGLTFSVDGYLIAGPGTLTLDAVDVPITVPSGIARIDAGLYQIYSQKTSKEGAGTLSLGGATNLGSLYVNDGTLRLEHDTYARELGITANGRVEVAERVTVRCDLLGSSSNGVYQLGQDSILIAGWMGGSASFAGSIRGEGQLVKVGNGTLTLGSRIASTYSGPTTITGGTLMLYDNSPALPATTAVILNWEGGAAPQLRLRACYQTIGSLTCDVDTGGSVNFDSATLRVGSDHSSTVFDGQLKGSGTLIKVGVGTLTLKGDNASFRGDIVIEEGAIAVPEVARTLGTSGGTLQLGGSTGSGLLIFTDTGGVVNLPLKLNAGGGTVEVRNAAATIDFAGAVSSPPGAGRLTKTGPGTMRLSSGTNTFGSGISINQGTLQVMGGGGIGDGSAVILADAPGVFLSVLENETIGSLAGGGTSGGSVLLNQTLTIAGSEATTFRGEITGHGGLTKSGSGMLTLSGANTFTGAVTIQGGLLRLGADMGLEDANPVVLSNAADAVLDLAGNRATVASLSGGGPTGGTVVLGYGGSLSIVGNDSTTFSGSITGTGGNLVMAGEGDLTLAGAISYTGATEVKSGTLLLEQGLGTPGEGISVGGTLRARNLVNRAISGDGSIVTIGNLLIGDLTSPTGFAFAGQLHVRSALVLLLDSDMADLGTATTLSGGGRLDALNGISLHPDCSVTANAAATIAADFSNHGTANGPVTTGQVLTFTGDVTGPGSFTGNVLFSDGFAPDPTAAGTPMQNLALDTTATLAIEITGRPAQAGSFTRILTTGTAFIGGTLNLTLHNTFGARVGDRWKFIASAGTPVPRSGTFNSVNLNVSGLPAGSMLAIRYPSDGVEAVLVGVTYEAWASGVAFLSPADAQRDADPDGDGIPNLIEYALNLDPLVANRGGMPADAFATVGVERFLALSYQRPAPPFMPTDISYAVERSTDLLNWSTAGLVPPVVTPDGDTGMESVVVRSSGALGTPGLQREFLRLAINPVSPALRTPP